MSIVLMAHQVAGYPDDDTAFAAGEALIKGGAKIIEIQLAFSDPSADGIAIQTACSTVLRRGYTVKDGFAYIKRLHDKHPDVQLFLMTYASLAYHPGIENFVKTAHAAGVSGFIIPDLPFDCDEGLGMACKKYGCCHIPVAAPSMTKERLHKMATAGYEYIYTVLRAGITGGKTTITDDMFAFLKAAGESGAKLLGGFGISSGEQAKLLAPHVYAVVAGSVFVNLITSNYNAGAVESSRKMIAEKLEEKARELSE
jgi:tryptophan synthase alpha chain